jgi:AGCS family alanine or glycine:cation symporter
MVFAPAVQINALSSAIRTSFDLNPWIIGVISAVLMAVVLVGGIKGISKFAELAVPFMALAYTAVSLYVLVRFVRNIPDMFGMIFEDAFPPVAATGGFAGSTVMLAVRWGLTRGVCSNEVGAGMVPQGYTSPP